MHHFFISLYVLIYCGPNPALIYADETHSISFNLSGIGPDFYWDK